VLLGCTGLPSAVASHPAGSIGETPIPHVVRGDEQTQQAMTRGAFVRREPTDQAVDSTRRRC
jgi:hypothetical protein